MLPSFLYCYECSMKIDIMLMIITSYNKIREIKL
ncbi:hypothetical protein BCD_0969 (plasmid) [Borrelia crocidurae DOU]|uniref:Uncharacterized protein n=1 Tax=Borrelia crocidurae DOU TaxID=1293575 RepID=W5SJG2_9SPIR|nr:hypothetical protein BCD_0969 [Borrelia crocidurae DOU]